MTTYQIPDEIKNKYPYASWVGGRGWAGHKSLESARKAAKRSSNAPVYQGYPPQVIIIDCNTQETK